MQLSRIGPIALEESLGGSPDSNVLRGIHIDRNLKLAVKLVPRELIHRPMGGDTFAADVKTLQKLVHPGIARVMGGAIDNGQPYLAIEYVEGESLRQRLDRLGRLPWETAVDLADEIAVALDYAHKAGVVHGRLTPARVLLPKEGGVKLVGFDCAWSDRDEVMGLRVPIGEAHYLAQEVYRGKRSSTLPTTDLFSLGVILYECLTGQMPWPSRTVRDLVQIRREGPAPRSSASMLDCPVWLDALVAKLLELHRVDRYPSAEEAHRAIVLAKSKVAAGTGATKQALSGQHGTLKLKGSSDDLSKLRKHAARREKKADVPWFERAWFLVACIAAILGVGAWVLWPASEEDLYAKAKPLIESEDAVDWQRAEPIVAELIERFPDTEHRKEIDDFLDQAAMRDADARIRNLDRIGRAPDSELERAYAQAWRNEKLGDRLSAYQKYEAIVNRYEGKTDRADRAIVNLARMGADRMRAAGQAELNLSETARATLDEAKKLMDEGNLLPARAMLDGVVKAQDGNPALTSLVEKARGMIREIDEKSK